MDDGKDNASSSPVSIYQMCLTNLSARSGEQQWKFAYLKVLSLQVSALVCEMGISITNDTSKKVRTSIYRYNNMRSVNNQVNWCALLQDELCWSRHCSGLMRATRLFLLGVWMLCLLLNSQTLLYWRFHRARSAYQQRLLPEWDRVRSVSTSVDNTLTLRSNLRACSVLTHVGFIRHNHENLV